jgi:hypothetical protein
VKAWLVRLFPRAWRERFGDEFAALLDDTPLSAMAVLDVVRLAAVTHARVRWRGLVWLVAAVAFTCAQVAAVRAGVTRNVLWPPTSVERGIFLALTLAPIAAALTVTRTSLRRA